MIHTRSLPKVKTSKQLEQNEFLRQIQAVIDEAPELYQALKDDKFG